MTFPETAQPQAGEAQAARQTPALFLCCLARGRAAELGTLLARHSGAASLNGLDDLAAALAEHPEVPALVLYDGPIQTLARPGIEPAEALSAWTEQGTALLALQARNRRRVRLADTRSLRLYPDVFVARMGLPAECTDAIAALPRPELDPVLKSLAQVALQQAPEARRLAASLQAASLDLSNSAPEPSDDLDAAFARYRELQTHLDEIRADAERQRLNEAQLTKAAADLRQSRQALENELARIKAELARDRATQEALRKEGGAAIARAKALQDRIDSLSDEAKRKDDELGRLRQANTEVTAERDTLRSQSKTLRSDLEAQYHGHHAARAALTEAKEHTGLLESEVVVKQAEIEALRAAQDDLQQRLRDTEDRLRGAEHWLEGIMASKSYRVMAPLRRLRAAFMKKD
ncbi:coiled-coil domain-containing protein [Salipiger aestuarii]|uniref:hypothetical protein n=1 Tax=Salipiger aestuarii TaxID=568098 RepID=UPI00123AE106|nr:hypothetical protein [Salipiger aestuarii]KAA8610028.1 hypothetical protein AL037_14345 [Salipiger aestuarii]